MKTISPKFTVSNEVIDLIKAADGLESAAREGGALAVLTLARSVSDRAFKHGEAKSLSDLLAENGVRPAAAKRVAEISAQLVNAGHHTKLVAKAAAKTRQAATMAGEEAWDAFWCQAGECTSMSALRALAKKAGPKIDKADKADKADDKADIIQGAPVANDPAQEKAMALESYKTALKSALKAGISPDTLKALILAAGKAAASKTLAA